MVDEAPAGNWYRPDATTLTSLGLPDAEPWTRIRNPDPGGYVRLTRAVRDGLTPSGLGSNGPGSNG